MTLWKAPERGMHTEQRVYREVSHVLNSMKEGDKWACCCHYTNQSHFRLRPMQQVFLLSKSCSIGRNYIDIHYSLRVVADDEWELTATQLSYINKISVQGL